MSEYSDKLESITDRYQSYVRDFEVAKQSFLEKFDNNPEYTLEWKSEAMIKAQARYVVAKDLLAYDDLTEGLPGMIRQLESAIRRNQSRSTSDWANAIDRVKRDEYVQLLEQMEYDHERLLSLVSKS